MCWYFLGCYESRFLLVCLACCFLLFVFVVFWSAMYWYHLMLCNVMRHMMSMHWWRSKSYWCLAGNFREWSTIITINNHPIPSIPIHSLLSASKKLIILNRSARQFVKISCHASAIVFCGLNLVHELRFGCWIHCPLYALYHIPSCS